MVDNKDYLEHYASPYYDPVKAHEYYMAHRKLKGRRSSSKLNETGKEAWAYTKEQISKEKKSAIESERAKRDATIKSHREKAAESRERLSAKMKRINEILTQRAKRQRENATLRSKQKREAIARKREREIERLKSKEPPSGLTKKQKSEWIAKRNNEIASLRDDAKAQVSTVSAETTNKRAEITTTTKNKRAEARESISKKRKRVANNLSKVIKATREAYKQAKDNIDVSYEQLYQREYDKIAAELPNPRRRR